MAVMAPAGEGLQLTGDQDAAVAGILEAIEAPCARVVLCGYAGTGKTVTTAALVSDLIEQGKRVVVATPTHKARAQVERALRNFGAEGFEAVTVHRMLGLKQVRDRDTGKEGFALDPGGKNMLTRPQQRWDEEAGQMVFVPPVDVVIVDETSMLSSDLYRLLLQEVEDRPIVFVGDDRQLLPVGEEEVCPAFVDSEPIYRLTEVLRHDGAILNLATETRQRAVGRALFVGARGGGSHVVAHASWELWQEALLTMAASDEAMADPDHCRAIAWTNRAVNELNQRIHVRRYGPAAPQFVVGMTCVTADTIPSPDGGSPLLNSTVDVLVESSEREEFVAPGDSAADAAWEAWRLDVRPCDGEEVLSFRVLDRSAEKRWNEMQRRIAELAKGAENQGDRREFWETYFRRKDQVGRLEPASALTIHKSQGSTFRHVFLHWSIDGFGGKPTALQNQLAYVGITRAAETLQVVADRVRRVVAA